MENRCIKWIRESLDLTQKQFAEKLGTKQQIIGMVENNKRDVSKNIIHALYTKFNIHYEEVKECRNRQELLSIINNSSKIQDNPYTINLTLCVPKVNKVKILNQIISLSEMGNLTKLEVTEQNKE